MMGKYAPEATPAVVREKLGEGWSREQVAGYLGVRARTLRRWERQYPALREALQNEAAMTEARVEAHLARLIKGFICLTVTLEKCGKTTKRRSMFRQMPPSVAAANCWLRHHHSNGQTDEAEEQATGRDNWAQVQAALAAARVKYGAATG